MSAWKLLTASSAPTNCHFQIHDAEDEWNFGSPFDYIHGRALLSCFTDPRSIWQKAYDSLAPGGYLELYDGIFPFKYIGEAPKDSAMYQWSEAVSAGAMKSGRPWNNTQYFKKWLEEIGFEDIVERKFYWPTGGWPVGEYYKTLAAYWQENMTGGGLEAISRKVLALMGWSEDETEKLLSEVKKDFLDTSIHAYLPM
jgi:SAM-dependent methyltransferase